MGKARKPRQSAIAEHALQSAIEAETTGIREELAEAWRLIADLQARLESISQLAGDARGGVGLFEAGGGGNENAAQRSTPPVLSPKIPGAVQLSALLSKPEVLLDEGEAGDMAGGDNLGEGRWV